MVAQPEHASFVKADPVATEGVTHAAGDNGSAPPIKSEHETGASADLPAGVNEDRASDQQAGDHNGGGNTQRYCPWCGGPLSAEAREAASRTRQRMAKSVSRYLAGDLTVTVGDTPDRPGEAKYSEQAARYLAEVPIEQFPPKTAPNRRRGRPHPA